MPGLFKDPPRSVEVFRPENILCYAALYDHSDNVDTDIANADAALKKICRLLDATWLARNGGVRETKATGGITDVARGDAGVTLHPLSTGLAEAVTDVVITCPEWEAVAGTRTVLPIVHYRGDTIIPLSKIRMIGDGKSTGEKVIIVDNTGLAYGPADPVDADWAVTFHNPLSNFFEADVGGIDLPVTTTKTRIPGVSNAAITRTTQDGEEGSGSLTLLETKGRFWVSHGAGGANPEVFNHPGEDAEFLMDSARSAGVKGKESYLPTGKSLAVLLVEYNADVANLIAAAAADVGQVFAKMHFHYGCDLTKRDNMKGLSGSTTDPLSRQFSLKWREKWSQSLLTRLAA